ncbi:protein of unknown function DUF1648 [Coriobacterium glomerans PW2]|uniref:DUF1648 domain-containing protein n=1 Tax=Coriobacterium glomerans (strain ATCC 49209 / DSM 20642 / JCM 10262 / PW2) TaxID=700015 RepID=F2N8T0_CORGP|nr:SdpI family protein [Coriobacterium glomerans]AEB07463.1 protein of unknown function DUF1648 [Coriobacterium glomerans PW2]
MTRDRDQAHSRPAWAGDPLSLRAWIALIALTCASMLIHALLYPQLPALIPTHWGQYGIDGWAPRWMALVFDAIPFLVVVVMWIVPQIDPRGRNFDRFKKVYRAFAVVCVMLVIAVTWLPDITVWAVAPEITQTGIVARLFYAIIGSAMLALGNFLPRVRQNYFFGYKTPWALHDERNWFLTHRFAGTATIVFGIAYLTAAILCTPTGYIDQGIILVIVNLCVRGAVYIYSLLVFCRDNRPLLRRPSEPR